MVFSAKVGTAVAAVALAALLSACVGSTDPTGPATGEPQGPAVPSSSGITLLQLAGLVGEGDAPPQALFDVGEASTSGADLLAEQQYWVSVGGTPEECADVVASAYLVSSADAANQELSDDPTGAIGVFSEEEDLFGLIQVYSRVFDSDADASAFIDRLLLVVEGCPGYRFVAPAGDVAYEARDLTINESTTPDGTRVVRYSETIEGTDALGVGITFVQHENAVVAIYSEFYPDSTMTPADADSIANAIVERINVL